MRSGAESESIQYLDFHAVAVGVEHNERVGQQIGRVRVREHAGIVAAILACHTDQ